ncbi:MAG: hypothetical protein H7Y14_01480, partial [Burkholderiales bacterium]|nr:hypothetical protein [Burkholderiales bacterium]
FARRHESGACITVAPRLVAGLGIQPGELPCGAAWQDTRIELGFLKEGDVLVDAISGESHRVANGGLAMKDLLQRATVAVLVK